MAATPSQSTANASTFSDTEDRYCRHCGEISLVFDPAASGPRCRDCGELA